MDPLLWQQFFDGYKSLNDLRRKFTNVFNAIFPDESPYPEFYKLIEESFGDIRSIERGDDFQILIIICLKSLLL